MDHKRRLKRSGMGDIIVIAIMIKNALLTLRFGVREHGCRVRQGRLDAPASADRARGCADVSTNRDVPAHAECFDSVLAVQDDDEVCDVGADLEAPAESAGCDAGGRGP